MKKFMAQFKFDQKKVLAVGVEREYFLLDQNGRPVHMINRVLKTLTGNDPNNFGYELSACQIESRSQPGPLSKLKRCLSNDDRLLTTALRKHELNCGYYEVGPEDIPLDVYPNPRYLEIVKTLPRHILLAACRVIGTHVHIGMPDHQTALRVYNAVIPHTEELSKIGDGSNGERLKIYQVMAPDCQPLHYENWEDFYQVAIVKNFVSDPRKCWTLIRISVHGTIEFRMFGTTSDLDKIVGWVTRCHELCRKAMT